jgi:AraC-like DNA-binding protein
MTQRTGRLGPITVIDLTSGLEDALRWTDERTYYLTIIPIKGQVELVHQSSFVTAGPGVGAVCGPYGDLVVPRWHAGGRTLTLMIDRDVVEDCLSDVVGFQVKSRIAFDTLMHTTQGAGRGLVQMLLMLSHELGQTHSALNQSLVAAPLIESVIRTFLLAATHPHRGGLMTSASTFLAPKSVRTVVQTIEQHPDFPLTVSLLAAQSHVTERALQQGFRRHMGMSPMAYLRQARLHRAHQQLLESDATAETVAAVAKRWGFTNAGRFAAAYLARYREAPASALRRSSTVIAEARPGPRNEPVDPAGRALVERSHDATRLG